VSILIDTERRHVEQRPRITYFNGGMSPASSMKLLFYTTTTIVASSNPTPFGQPLTLTAGISAMQSDGTAAFSGTVVFIDGAGPLAPALGSVQLPTGGPHLKSIQVPFTTSSLSAGDHVITARYFEDANFAGSEGQLQQTVLATPQVTLTVTKTGTGGGTVTSNPAGITCGATCSQNYAKGAVVMLAAQPDLGSVFAGWSGACTGAASSTSVTMTAAESCTATFNPGAG
jgi:hypothetical protein